MVDLLADKARQPLISVVIPSYNRATFIAKTLNSIFEQTHTNLEIIVVDDCSKDNTEQVICSIDDPRIVYIQHSKNKGAPAARNTGIQAAKGEYIAFLDSDDTWSADKLEKQLAVMDQSPFTPGLVFTGIDFINAQGDVRYVHLPKQAWRGHVYKKMLGENLAGTTSTALVRRECFAKSGIFDEVLRARQDYDLWLRISKHYAIDFVREPLTHQYEHDDQRITTDISNRIQGRNVIFEKIANDLKNYPKKLARYHYETGALYFGSGDIKQGRRLMLKSLRYHPIPKAFALYLLSFVNKRLLNRARGFSRQVFVQRLKNSVSKRSRGSV